LISAIIAAYEHGAGADCKFILAEARHLSGNFVNVILDNYSFRLIDRGIFAAVFFCHFVWNAIFLTCFAFFN